MRLLLLALLALNPAAFAAPIAAPSRAVALPAAAALAPIPPMLLTGLDSPQHPLSLEIASLSSSILGADAPSLPEAAAAVLGEASRSEEPVRRAAAASLARALTAVPETSRLMLAAPGLVESDFAELAPAFARAGGKSALAPLARPAFDDPALAAVFDGRAEHAAAGLGGSALEGETLVHRGRGIESLGRGFFGIVHPHPDAEGVVVKTDFPRALRHGEPDSMPARRVAEDRIASREASRLGFGPRLLGQAEVGGRRALLKERVYGETVKQLLERGAFGPEEHALIEHAFSLAAREALLFADPRPENLIIGRTLLDPVRRAYVVDPGRFFPARDGLTAEDAVEWLFTTLRQLTVPLELLERFDRIHFGG